MGQVNKGVYSSYTPIVRFYFDTKRPTLACFTIIPRLLGLAHKVRVGGASLGF